MTAQPRRKPRRVVLGRGYLAYTALHPGHVWVECVKSYQVKALNRVALRGAEGTVGTLIWEPDPPKAKR